MIDGVLQKTLSQIRQYGSWLRFKYSSYYILKAVISAIILLFPLSKSYASDYELRLSSFNAIPGWHQDNHLEAYQSLQKSCKTGLVKKNKYYENLQIRNFKESFNAICKILKRKNLRDPGQAKDFFMEYFVPYKVHSSEGSYGTLTGYYVPRLEGSRQKGGKYQFPIYTTPSELEYIADQIPREVIDSGYLKGRNLELFYVTDEVDLFFLHIQGSGFIELPNGDLKLISYAAKNNYPYRSIGNYMIELGEIDNIDMSAYKIKSWLKANPDLRDRILHYNESYIFFREVDDNVIRGASTTELTAERSLAIDPDYYPYGMPIFVDSRSLGKEYNKLMIAQDTGSAIKGVLRGDVYFGVGSKAEKNASYLKNNVQFYALIPKDIY